jgi:hydroxypyruvate reductase/glycerate 2-kinase
MEQRELLKDIFRASLEAVDPYGSVRDFAKDIKRVSSEGSYRRLVVLGFGKAACPMAKAIEELFEVERGLVITKYGHCRGRYRPKKIEVREAAHPVPDKNGFEATQEIMALVKNLSEDTLVVCLISGGGSALLVSPLEGITLDEKRQTTELLLRAGTDIHEVNTVRKHISSVKGGRMAGLLHPARVISLMLSDVIGDNPDVIASGPTSPDPSTYEDALGVLKKYGLTRKVPQSVLKAFEKGVKGSVPETPKHGDKIFDNVENVIIGSNRKAMEAGRRRAGELGFRVETLSMELTGEAKDAGRWLAEEALKTRERNPGQRLVLLSGGETTVTVRGSGRGGRNTELALSFAMAIEGVEKITLLSAGTDGTDGATDAAGAVVDGASVARGRKLGLEPQHCLADNDSYTFFKKTGDIFIIGPTGTNVMDLQMMIVG